MNIPCENHAGVTEDIVICCYLALHTCAVLRITQEITQGDTGKVLHVGDPFVKEEVQRWGRLSTWQVALCPPTSLKH